MAFNPNQHLLQLKSREGSKDYLPVQWRIVWFREMCPQGTIDTEELDVDLDREVEAEVSVWNNEKRRSEKVIKRGKGYARYKATVTDGNGGRATGTKSENAAHFPDFAEKAETGSIGRALAGLGYGTQFTGDEFDEGERMADAPAARGDEQAVQSPPSCVEVSTPVQPQAVQPGESIAHSPITEQQRTSIEKICVALGQPTPIDYEQQTYLQAKETIQRLTALYRQAQQAKKEKKAS